ncbi:hypothetical protein KP509_1Z312800 [Ceratopteris richardii]|nr:hypothetical protein KP509_1Z312800 [Ceratopteris richardii]
MVSYIIFANPFTVFLNNVIYSFQHLPKHSISTLQLLDLGSEVAHAHPFCRSHTWQVEDYELERTQRRVKKQYRLFDAESTALDIDFQGNYFVKDDTVANMLNALVLESSSDDSSETEDAVNISECQNLKSVKQEEMKAQKLPELEPPVQIPVQQFFSVRTDQREDVDELSMDIVLSLNAHDFEDVQESAARHVHSRCLVSESCKPMSLSQHNLQIDDAKLRADVGSLKSDGLPSSRNKPQSLVDAIKWNNVKSKKAAAIKARLSLKNPI